ncbi:MAG: alcohol dehydrogenase catalytic domain-containing protein [Dehalococcoidia bacterium]|nr:alcohol dehydrogenase catalytic domain-containing protein [Dehalococcoidia bacterium]
MKAAIFEGPNHFEIRQVPDPRPAEDEFVVRVDYCGLCGSDLEIYHGSGMVMAQGMILGHEFAGEIVEAGPGAARKRLGQKVAVLPALPCGRCDLCTLGRGALCRDSTPALGLKAAGGLAEYVAVPAASAIPLGDLSTRAGALAEPISVAAHGVDVSGIQRGQTAIVVGCGPIGALTTQVLRALGAGVVIVSEVSSYRRELASRAGATVVVDPAEQDLRQVAREIAGPRGVDFVFECAGSPTGFTQGLSALRPTGTMVILSVGRQPMPLVPLHAVVNEYVLKGAFAYTDGLNGGLRLLREGLVDTDAVVSGERALDKTGEAFDEMASGRAGKLLVRVGA